MRLLKFLSIAAVAATLAACGGGGGGTAAAPELRGTAAIGAPLPNATVTLRGANGTERNATANAMGEFVFTDLSGLTAPAMLRAVGNAGGQSHTLFSVTPTLPTAPGASAVTNVTPLTHAVTQQVMGADLAAAFATPANLNVTALNTAIDRVLAVLAPSIVAVGAPAGANPFTTAFTANQTGLDKLLDLIDFSYANGNLTVRDAGTGTALAVVPTTGAVPPPPPALPALAWDLTGLKPFIERFNAADDAARTGMFHANYRHDGFTDVAVAVRELRGGRVEQVSIDGCRVANSIETCTIRGLLVNPVTIDIPFVIDSRRIGTEWRIFGNQLPFTLPAATRPTAAAVPTGRFNWSLPAAPANAILQGNFTGNMAFRMILPDGATHTVQATVASTLYHSQMAFGPLPNNPGNLIVNTTRHSLNSDSVQTRSTLNGQLISVMADGAGNAMVGCPLGMTFQSTVVLLSHNLRPVTLDHALANGLAGRTFDAMDCFHARMMTTAGGHNEWFRFNPDGSVIAGDDPNAAIPIVSEELTRAQMDAMLSPSGLVLTAPPVASVERAQIYELMIGTRRMFFVLYHFNEGNGTHQDVMLGIPR